MIVNIGFVESASPAAAGDTRAGRARRGVVLLIVVLTLQLGFGGTVSAQLDETHWIPPFFFPTTPADGTTACNPTCSSNASCCIRHINEHYLMLSTPDTTPVPVFVRTGVGVVVWNGTISNTAPAEVRLGHWDLALGKYVDDLPGAGNILTAQVELNVPSTRGLVVTADQPIYANVRHRSANHGDSLSAKGRAALGTRFRAGFMRNRRANTQGPQNFRSLFVSVMAIEDETTVVFDEVATGIKFLDLPATLDPSTTDRFEITLQALESVTIGLWAKVENPQPVDKINDVNGTLITSLENKPVVVNTGVWTGGPHGTTQDIGFDQLVPEQLAGTEYVLIKGNSGPLWSVLDSPMVLAVEPDTFIFLNGSTSPATLTTCATGVSSQPLGAGDWCFLGGDDWSDSNGDGVTDNMFVHTSQPVLMFQTLGGANAPATPGFNVVPALDTFTHNAVDNIPSIDFLGDATLGIVAEHGSWVRVNDVDLADPLDVPGTSDWVTYKMPSPLGDVTVESDGRIAVQFTNLNDIVGAAGYYSGFPRSTATLRPVADAGPDRDAGVGELIAFDGTGSFDQDAVDGGLPIRYAWDFDVATDSDLDGDPANDVDSSAPLPTYAYSERGTFVVKLVYTDDDGQSDSDFAVVTVTFCVDLDDDGYGSPGSEDCPAGSVPDCNDQDPAVHPGAAERCNGIDDDCNGLADDDFVGGDCTVPGALGVCANGTEQCVDGEACAGGDDPCVACVGPGPAPEVCRLDPDCDPLVEDCRRDEDCDGVLEECAGCPDSVPCDSGCDADGDGVPNCADNCPDAFNPVDYPADCGGVQCDSDGDEIGDACDCDDLTPPADLRLTKTLPADCDDDPTTPDRPCTELSWGPTGAHRYHVYRGYRTLGDPFAFNQQCMASDLPEPTVIEPFDPLPHVMYFYWTTVRCAVGSNESTLGEGRDAAGQPTVRPANLVCPDPRMDLDGDGTTDAIDNCPPGPLTAPSPCLGSGSCRNDSQSDVDGDSRGDVCDNCIQSCNTPQDDADGDGIGDCCDTDLDADGVPQDGDDSGSPTDNPCPSMPTAPCDDNCPTVANPDQLDDDGNGVGNACEGGSPAPADCGCLPAA